MPFGLHVPWVMIRTETSSEREKTGVTPEKSKCKKREKKRNQMHKETEILAGLNFVITFGGLLYYDIFVYSCV